MPVPHTVHTPERYAIDTGREFDPTTEAHHFGFTVKMVDPGCTLELQIEERSGRVTRLTTGDTSSGDRTEFLAAIVAAAYRMFDEWEI